MIRMLTEGVRREELAQQQITDLSADLIARPFVRVIPLKGARDFSGGRLVPPIGEAEASLGYEQIHLPAARVDPGSATRHDDHDDVRIVPVGESPAVVR
jgi:hypothetical protein